MSRRVGEFYDPITGEKDWVVINQVNSISKRIFPRRIKCTTPDGLQYTSEVTFELNNIDMLNVVTLTASVKIDDKKYTSEQQQMNELEFANIVADCVYNDRELDEPEEIQELIDAAMQDLKGSLFDDMVIVDGLSLESTGFVTVDGHKVNTIDKVDIDILDNRYKLHLKNCTGPLSISKLESPKIEFHSSGLTFLIDYFTLEEENDGKLKSYTIETDELLYHRSEQTNYFDPVKLDTSDDESIGNFINNRKKYLDNIYDNEDNSLEDRFSDIF